ncbi:hypothetical protein AB6A40_006557 [Gnathostoma spinigerum]|uniref:Uncharacterized protein n=1 Tax=Gnathostoma spinigerum TaxID=75299 RepID=A0ABD6EIX2_9BILA
MEDLAREKEIKKNMSNEERIHRTAERSDLILNRINDLITKDSKLNLNVQDLESRLNLLGERQTEILIWIHQILTLLNATTRSSVSATHDTSPVGREVQLSTSLGDIPEPISASSSSEALVSASSRVELMPTTNVEGSTTFGDDQSSFFAPTIRRTRTTTVTCGEHPVASSRVISSKNDRYGSLLSLKRTGLHHHAPTDSPCGSARQTRPHDEYTSITDSILTGNVRLTPRNVSEKRKIIVGVDVATENDEDEENMMGDDEDDNPECSHYSRCDTPTTTLKRAKPSYLRRRNTLFQEYEEEIAEGMRGKTEGKTSFDAWTQCRHDSAPGVFASAAMDRESWTETELNSSKEYIEFSARGKSDASENSGSSRNSRSSSGNLDGGSGNRLSFLGSNSHGKNKV